MTRESEEYKQFCTRYEAEKKERKDNPGKYPYFAYFQYGIDAMYALVEGAKPIIEADKEYEVKVITRGNCMICGKELTEGLFICNECGEKANKESEDKE